jgi:hypothetical protein
VSKWTDEQIGKRFSAWDGRVYRCESYVPNMGFWMVAEGEPPRRTNVSYRAIGRTFHVLPQPPQEKDRSDG